MYFASLKEAYNPIVPDAFCTGIIEDLGKPVQNVEEFDPMPSEQHIDEYYRHRQHIREPQYKYNNVNTNEYEKTQIVEPADDNNYYKIDEDLEILNQSIAEKVKLKCKMYMAHFMSCKECKIKAYKELINDPDIKEMFESKSIVNDINTNTNSIDTKDMMLFIAIGILLIYVFGKTTLPSLRS